MRRSLTVKAIESLQPALPGRRYDVPDALVPGFGVRVSDKGKKSYTLTTRFPGAANPTRRTIGAVNVIDLAAARETARTWLSQILCGVDPSEEDERRKREAASPELETFGAVANQFVNRHVLRNRLRSAPEIQRILARDILPKWSSREFRAIRRGDVARLLDEIEVRAPVHADHVLAVLSKLCNWYQAREEDYTSPIVRGMRRTNPHERARERILNDQELAIIWSCAERAGVFGAFLRLALLTAQRRTKVQRMRWTDISDDGLWSIPSEAREKSNAKRLTLPPLALEIIESLPRVRNSDFVFAGRDGVPINGFSKAKRNFLQNVDEAVGGSIPNWTVHDLRRTARSLMSRAAVRPEIAERVLGHAIVGVEGIYDRYSYDAEKADALAKLAVMVKEIILAGEKSAAERRG